MPRDLLTLLDRGRDELVALVASIVDGTARAPGGRGRRVAVVWDGEAFRHRAALDLAIMELGCAGAGIVTMPRTDQIVGDLAANLGLWFDAIVVRTPRHEAIARLAELAEPPVLNAGSWLSHPCEVLADVAHLARLGRLPGARVAFLGAATNVCRTWCEAAARLPISVVQVCPPGHELAPEWLERLRAESGADLAVTHDLAGVEGADVVYTDCWWPVRRAGGPARDELARAFAPYRVTARLVESAGPRSIFLHGPPLTPGLEATPDALRSSRCQALAAKALLLPTYAAVLADVLS